MRFFKGASIFERLGFSSPPAFDSIQGYEDLKEIIKRVLDSEDSYNLLFVGPPASSKTLFLQGILDIRNGNGNRHGQNGDFACPGSQ
jgi:hypothetical protein